MLKIYFIYTAIISFITFLLFGIDKALSKKETNPRIPEIVLLSFSSFGGALGGLLARGIFRHKTVFKTKFHFAIGLWVAVALQASIPIYMIIISDI